MKWKLWVPGEMENNANVLEITINLEAIRCWVFLKLLKHGG